MAQINEMDRYFIQDGLDRGATPAEIAGKINKNRTTVNREILKHRSFFNGTEEFVPKCVRLVRPPY
ncbi:MAG: helix-turn-helix domain-containing protein, partial [Victivallales bacterium]|nr:helix-turn-helix domain-containing protein [Victivallales bacterium]